MHLVQLLKSVWRMIVEITRHSAFEYQMTAAGLAGNVSYEAQPLHPVDGLYPATRKYVGRSRHSNEGLTAARHTVDKYVG